MNTVPVIRVRAGKPVKTPYYYHWRNMPLGAKKICASPIDAVIEVLMYELKIAKSSDLLTDLGIPNASISRCRHRVDAIRHSWLVRAAILSNIPYVVLCEVASEQPEFTPHHNAKEWK